MSNFTWNMWNMCNKYKKVVHMEHAKFSTSGLHTMQPSSLCSFNMLSALAFDVIIDSDITHRPCNRFIFGLKSIVSHRFCNIFYFSRRSCNLLSMHFIIGWDLTRSFRPLRSYQWGLHLVWFSSHWNIFYLGSGNQG